MKEINISKNKISFFSIALILLITSASYSQMVTSYGLKFSYATNYYGWQHPDRALDSVYFQPSAQSYWISLTGEFFNRRFLSTPVALGIKFRSYKFNYNVIGTTGSVIGTSSVKNDITWATLSIAERVRFPISTFFFYAYGGLVGFYRIGNNISTGFGNVYGSFKKSALAVTTGAGITKGFGNYFVSLEAYFNPDLTKTYTSNTGQVRDTEIGVSIGFGLFDSKNMLK